MKPIPSILSLSFHLTHCAFWLAMGAGSLPGATHYSDLIKGDQPFLYWNFDEAADNALQQVDLSTTPPTTFTANDLIPVGAERVNHASIGSSLHLGNAASFSGSTYFIANGLKTGTNALGGAWIVEFWMQVQGEPAERRNDYLLDFGDGGGNHPAVLYDYVGSATPDNGLELFAGGRTDVGPEVADDLWHHVVFVFYGNGTAGVADRADVYVDGVATERIRGGFNSTLTMDGRFVVGTSAPQFAAGDGFEGRLDEVAIYDLSTLGSEDEVTAKAAKIATHFATASGAGSYSEAVKADAPFLYWNFDEASGAALELTGRGAGILDTGTENDLVPTGNITRIGHDVISSGLKLGNAVEIDGASYLRAPALRAPTNSVAPPYAIEFWMQVLGENADILRNEYLISMGGDGGNQPAVIYDYVGGGGSDQLELFQCCGAGAGRSIPGPAISDEEWHHVFIVFYGTDTNGVSDRLEVYLDGVSDHQSIRNTYRRDLNLATQFIVGSSPVLADAFTGRLDEVAIYDLSAFTTEAALEAKVSDMASKHHSVAAQADGNYGATVLADHPLLYWNFNEADGNALQQIKAPTERITANDLTPAGATRVSHSAIQSGLDLGNAADLSGSNYFMAEKLSAPKAALAAPWLIEFWFQIQGPNTDLRNDYLVNFGGGGGNHPAVLYDYVGGARAQNGLELFAGPRSGEGPIVDDSNWHYAAFAYYGDPTSGVTNRLDIYVDGILTAPNVRGTFSSALTVDSRIVVGNSAPQFATGDGFQGRMDELALYDLSSLTTESAVTAKVSDLVSRHFAGALVSIDNPSLSISKTGDQVVLSWPTAAAGFVLESTDSLITLNWVTVPETPVVKGFTRTVTLTPLAKPQFFQLRK